MTTLILKVTKMSFYIHKKKRQKSVESSIISNYNIIKQRPSFFNLSPYLVEFQTERYQRK